MRDTDLQTKNEAGMMPRPPGRTSWFALFLILMLFLFSCGTGCLESTPPSPVAATEALSETLSEASSAEPVAPSEWITSLPQAKEAARASGKPIFALFTGSTWCPGCIYMESRIFSRKPFADFAKERFVLLKFDLPRTALKTDDDRRAATAHLEYRIDVVPTVLLLDADGNTIRNVAVYAESAGVYVAGLKNLLDE
ncbi:MAG TPA: hypothetical protein DEB39_08800 [Planctomycetaceae bacterium]|nr:hypothetical protein [Planctomycetaceae bacterium]